MYVDPMKSFLWSIAFALILFNVLAAATGLPGDDFRRAAEAYEHEAADAVEHAAASQGEAIGRYMQFAAVSREMAGIKRRAASLADVDRWDKITWDDHHALERRRNAILETLVKRDSDPVKQAGPGEAYDQNVERSGFSTA